MQRFLATEYPRLLDLLYDAALDPWRWQEFLDAVPESFGGATGILHATDGTANARIQSASFGHDAAYGVSYASYYGALNPYPGIGFHTLPVGKSLFASDYLASETVENTEFYNDWMKPQGITPDHLAISLRNDGGIAILSIAPRIANYSSDRDTYAERLQLLAPHLMRAVEINRVTSAACLAERNLSAMLDALGSAAFVLGRSGRLMIANRKAEDLMRTERVVETDRQHCLRATRPGDDTALAAAIAIAPITPDGLPSRPLRLTSQATGRVYAAWVLPVRLPRSDNPSGRFELFARIAAEPMSLVLMTPAEGGPAIPPDAIKTVFALSQAEAKLVSALSAGGTLAEYVKDTGLSRNTVRNQLASVFAKTGTTRQAELVSLIIGTLGPTSHLLGRRPQ